MKKAIVLFCAACLLVTALFFISKDESKLDDEKGASAMTLYCVEDEKVLYAENENSRISCASITKLLTACTALRYVGPDEVFTVGEEQELVNIHASICLISKGQRLTLYDLITGMLTVSGSDAAYTVAAETARRIYPDVELSDKEAVEKFCLLMNETAEEIGMKNSSFVNPDGQDDNAQYTTAADLVKLAEYSLSFPAICEIAAIQEKFVVFESGECITWTNSNKLLDPESEFYSEYAVGLKTGTTNKAGNCLAAVFRRDGKTYISIVTGCENDPKRYELTLLMFEKYI